MRRLFATVLLCGLMIAVGGVGAWVWSRQHRTLLPDPPSLVTQIREVARLETLDVALYKKISFEREPTPAGSTAGDVLNWVKFTAFPKEGKAIVFGEAHLGLDLSHLDASQLRVDGERVLVQLPPVQAMLELKPDQTEIIDSNLDSEQTAALFAKAKVEMLGEVETDKRLKEKARASAERAIRGLLLGVGFREVVFVDALPPLGNPG